MFKQKGEKVSGYNELFVCSNCHHSISVSMQNIELVKKKLVYAQQALEESLKQIIELIEVKQ